MMRGRPSSYTPELAQEICDRLAGGEALIAICLDDRMPSPQSVRRWALADTEGFSAEYTRARDQQADHIAEEALSEALAARDPSLARLAFDARRWYAGKIAPRKYGDKLQHTGDGGGAVAMQIITGVPRDSDPD